MQPALRRMTRILDRLNDMSFRDLYPDMRYGAPMLVTRHNGRGVG